MGEDGIDGVGIGRSEEKEVGFMEETVMKLCNG